ncbi:MAG: glycosyltransferase [Gaiellales bacterium]
MPDPTPRLLMLGQINHIHVAHMANQLSLRGFEVILAGMRRPGYGATPETLPTIEVEELPFASGSTPAGVLSQIRAIRRLLAKHRPDVVQAHWLCGYGAFAAIAGARPLASVAWGSDVLRASRIQRLANRIALRRSALATGDSLDLCEAMIALGADRAKVAHVTWGVDLTRFSPIADRGEARRLLGLPDTRLVLSPRSLLPIYNPDVVLTAFDLLADRLPDVGLVLLSLYETEPDLSTVRHRDRVHVVGHVPYEQMPEYLRAADACVSIPSSDASPRTVWEAMACGTPVVLSDLPWVDHELDRDRDALVVPIEPGAVAAALGELLERSDRARALAASALARTAATRDVRVEMDRLAALLRSTLRPSRGSS